MRKVLLAACAGLLAACSNLDSVDPGTVRPTFVARFSTTVPQMGPPNVSAARAAEAAALSEIEAHLGPESRGPILAALKAESHDGFIYGVKGKTAEWQSRYDQFYAARAHRQDEERRDASVSAARDRGGIAVVVALGTPPDGAIAAVLRRPFSIPAELIVLGPTATAETLGGAFAALDQSRESYGDDLPNNVMVAISDVRVKSISAAHQTRLEQLWARLNNAPPRTIEGIGTTKAIDLRSAKLPRAKP